MKTDGKKFIKELKRKYKKYNINVFNTEKSKIIFISLGDNKLISLYIDMVGSVPIVSTDYLDMDERYSFELYEENYNAIFELIDKQISVMTKYYDTLRNAPQEVQNKICGIYDEIVDNFNNRDYIIIQDYFSPICMMCKVLDKENRLATPNRLMCRIDYQPIGYVITIIYNDPFDQQIDYVYATDFANFIKDFHAVLLGDYANLKR